MEAQDTVPCGGDARVAGGLGNGCGCPPRPGAYWGGNKRWPGRGSWSVSQQAFVNGVPSLPSI